MVIYESELGKVEQQNDLGEITISYKEYKFSQQFSDYSYFYHTITSLYKDGREMRYSWFKKYLVRLRKSSRNYFLSYEDLQDIWGLMQGARVMMELDKIIKEALRYK